MNFLIYGVANKRLRSRVNNYLDEGNVIIGVTDKYYIRDFLQGNRFIPYEDLAKEPFDYIVLCILDEEKRKSAKEELIKKGIPEDRIIGPGVLLLDEPEFIPDMEEYVRELSFDNPPKTLVLGLSYSLRGIDVSLFPGGGVDLSWHGQDLYYNLKQLEALKDNRPDIFDGLSTAILLFPLYYFNYDMSLSAYQYKTGQIYVNRSLNDHHNAAFSKDKTINEYVRSEGFFGKKFWQNKKWNPFWTGSSEVVDIEQKYKLTNVWKQQHTDTVRENEKILETLINELKNKDVFLVIPPILLLSIEEEDRKYYEEMKQSFLNSIAHFPGIKMIECDSIMDDHRCFADYEHLNDEGRSVFTAYLSKIIYKQN